MGTDLLKEQYNQLMENQKLKIKRLKDKQAKMTKQQNENDVSNFYETRSLKTCSF
jgi:hypothetical protein